MGRLIRCSGQTCRLDAGKSFSPKFAGEPIPLLDEVFEELGSKFLINVELKELQDTPRMSCLVSWWH